MLPSFGVQQSWPWHQQHLSPGALTSSTSTLFFVVGRHLGELGSHSLSSPALPGCFSKDQVYLDGILRILRHRQTIDFPLLAALGKVMPGGRWMIPEPCPIPKLMWAPSVPLFPKKQALGWLPFCSSRVPALRGLGAAGKGCAGWKVRRDRTIWPPLWETCEGRCNPAGLVLLALGHTGLATAVTEK